MRIELAFLKIFFLFLPFTTFCRVLRCSVGLAAHWARTATSGRAFRSHSCTYATFLAFRTTDGIRHLGKEVEVMFLQLSVYAARTCVRGWCVYVVFFQPIINTFYWTVQHSLHLAPLNSRRTINETFRWVKGGTNHRSGNFSHSSTVSIACLFSMWVAELAINVTALTYCQIAQLSTYNSKHRK